MSGQVFDIGGMKLSVRRVSDLEAAPYNPRTITPQALAALKLSIEKFSLVEPVVWNQRTKRVVGGHQRLKAMRELGIQDTVVVVVDLAEGEEKALNLTLNNDALMGQFNEATTELLEAARQALSSDLFEGLRFTDIFYPGKVLEFVPGAALDYGLTPEASKVDELPETGVRVMRLIFNDNTLAEVKGLLRKLGDIYGTEDITEIVMQALRDAINYGDAPD
jgi:ParB/Sulfiredoxin domain